MPLPRPIGVRQRPLPAAVEGGVESGNEVDPSSHEPDASEEQEDGVEEAAIGGVGGRDVHGVGKTGCEVEWREECGYRTTVRRRVRVVSPAVRRRKYTPLVRPETSSCIWWRPCCFDDATVRTRRPSTS